MSVFLCVCVYLQRVVVVVVVLVVLGRGVYPQTQVAQFFGESLAHPRGKSRRRRWGGEGTAALGEQSLISNLPKTGVFML